MALRIEVDWEAADEGKTILSILEAVAADPKAKDISALIIGAWEEAFETGIQPLIDLLVQQKGVFTSLKAVFFAEMTYEENEISWIQQGDYSAFWPAYPQLEHVQIRGMEGLSLGEFQHENLKTLIVETGGLGTDVIQHVANANLPSLEHLELWLGDENYGWDGSVDDIAPLLNVERRPSLKFLGLKNSEIADEIAGLLATSSLLSQLKTLDLSMGNISDKGAEAILASADKFRHLSKLNLAHHYFSDDMMGKLSALAIPLDLSGQEQYDDGERYIEVSE
ncbi:hypothetical protein A9Q99_06305 [Gammaproteobacteria bacterium 45_16_T64]|nr:hypothetical protein A9Q99_06305 [Gammaproteobacteria bacterium 45_16_T64]